MGASASETELERAVGLAYTYLNRRERTVREMRAHLARRDVEARVIDKTIALVTEEESLDDLRFARLFAQDKRELEGWGRERIKTGLRNRGIEEELIDQVLGLQTHDAELAGALDVLRRRFATPPRDRRERDRALGVLLRKGYDSELALDALAAYASGAASLQSR